MVINIKHTDYLETGAFINNENAETYKNYTKNETIFITQNNNVNLKEEIIKIINNSRTVLKICSFIITDKEIFDLILEKATSTNIAIFILTQLDKSKLTNLTSLSEFLSEEELNDKTSTIHISNIKKLRENGVHIRASESAHAKFIIADRDFGFIMSANLTTPSLNENTESGIYLDQNSSKELDKLFDIIYIKGTNYSGFIGSPKNGKMMVNYTQVNYAFDNLPKATDSNLRFTYLDLTTNLLDEIINIIDNANEYLYLSTYSIVGLQHIQKLVDALENSVIRGVKVFLFCRGMNYRNDHLLASEVLAKKGCEIFGNYDNHSKGVISETDGLIFTANIDGNHGLINGFEVGCKLNEKQKEDFLDFHKYLINHSNYKYKIAPQRIDLIKTYINYEKYKLILPIQIPSDLIVKANVSINVEKDDFVKLPIFYAISDMNTHLTVGNHTYDCVFEGNTFTIVKKQYFQFNREKYLLKFFNLTLEIV
jgi:phosphatidylserine/phosphatidylglycerophosphate/cardiolipin synthase-like enzyme